MTQLIRTRRCPHCFLCSATGHLLYSDLSDRLSESPGIWQIQRCPREGWGLLWVTGLKRQRDVLFSLYLRGTQPGHLLDVGCGDGVRLARCQMLHCSIPRSMS
jgi:hypothetical protein